MRLLSSWAWWVVLLVYQLTRVAKATEYHNQQGSDTGASLNLVLLLADNLGYDDVSCFRFPEGEAINPHLPKTPHIDRLAEEGIKFTNWNSAAALCSASRSALLTGKYPVRTGTYPGVFKHDAAFGLLPEETTLAELLKIEGYATSIV